MPLPGLNATSGSKTCCLLILLSHAHLKLDLANANADARCEAPMRPTLARALPSSDHGRCRAPRRRRRRHRHHHHRHHRLRHHPWLRLEPCGRSKTCHHPLPLDRLWKHCRVTRLPFRAAIETAHSGHCPLCAAPISHLEHKFQISFHGPQCNRIPKINK